MALCECCCSKGDVNRPLCMGRECAAAPLTKSIALDMWVGHGSQYICINGSIMG